MGRIHFTVFILLTFSLLSLPKVLFAEQPLKAGLKQAELYGREGKFDFAFMELRDLLRRYPEGPHVPQVEFGLAEYFFLQSNFAEARKAFSNCLSKIGEESTPRVLSQIYLLLCLEKTDRVPAAKTLLGQLKQKFSSQSFFIAFDDKRTHTWQSPLGIVYTLHEFVDRLEIYQNEKLFYTLNLP